MWVWGVAVATGTAAVTTVGATLATMGASWSAVIVDALVVWGRGAGEERAGGLVGVIVGV